MKILQKNAEKVIVRMHDTNFDGCLNDLRFINFKKHTSKFSFKSKSLPLTAATAAQRAFRIYFQVQLWQGNNSLHACDWGWISSVSGVKLICTEDIILILESLLKIVFCSCKGNTKLWLQKTRFQIYGNL